MKYYETLYIINPNLNDEEYRSVVTRFNNLVEKNNGVVTKTEEWGKKTLAYEVKKFGKGYYVLLQYCGEASIIEELNRDLRLDDKVIKFQTIKLSDEADPEALKAKAEQGGRRAEEPGETPEQESADPASEPAENEEGKDGVQ